MTVRLLFEPRDAWIGVFWRRLPWGGWEAFVCLVPMLPLHIRRAP
jgi:hypothetical protein